MRKPSSLGRAHEGEGPRESRPTLRDFRQWINPCWGKGRQNVPFFCSDMRNTEGRRLKPHTSQPDSSSLHAIESLEKLVFHLFTFSVAAPFFRHYHALIYFVPARIRFSAGSFPAKDEGLLVKSDPPSQFASPRNLVPFHKAMTLWTRDDGAGHTCP